MLPILALKSVGGFALRNWKPVGVLLLVLIVGGYIALLRHTVAKQGSKVEALKKDVATVQMDLGAAKTAIAHMAEGMEEYKKFVDLSIASIKGIQKAISSHNAYLKRVLDNLAVAAQEARRIQDAPQIPFFVPDNAFALVCVDNVNCIYKVRPLSD